MSTRARGVPHVRTALLLAAFTLLSVEAWPQPIAGQSLVAPGSRARLLAPEVAGQAIQGTVAETGLESVVILSSRGGERQTVPWRAITRLEVSTGRHGHAVKGLLIGAAAGMALSVVAPKCVNEGCSSEAGFDAAFAVAYGLGGSLWGGLIGAMVKTENWSAVPLRIAVAPTPGRGLRVALSISVK